MTTFAGTGPTTFAQERRYPARAAEGRDDVYPVVAAMHLDGELDVGSLHRAVREVTARHEALRASFASEDGALVQRIHDRSCAPSWTVTRSEPKESGVKCVSPARSPVHLDDLRRSRSGQSRGTTPCRGTFHGGNR